MIEDLLDQFLLTLVTADAKYVMKTEDKGDSWKESNLAYLYSKLKKHNIQLGALIATGHLEDIQMKAIDVLLYTLMIGQNASEMLGDAKKEM